MKVQSEGSLQSKIWLIGEAPGATEEAQGKPFVGGSGFVLNQLLQSAGLKRGDCYIDNVIQERPEGNDFGKFYLDAKRHLLSPQLLEGHARLRALIKEHKPNVVCALGNEALFALTGKKQITLHRGSVYGCEGVKVIGCYHPALVMRQYEFFPTAVFDLKRVLKESSTSAFPPIPQDKFIINPTFEQVIDKLEELKKEKVIAFDIETGLNQIMCLGFGWSSTESICVPIFFGGNSWWTLSQELAIINKIKELFNCESVNFVAQNAQFDITFLLDKWGAEPKNLWFDTMIAFHCLQPELPKSLAYLCSIYTDRPYYKDMWGQANTPEILWKYNCLDTVVTWEVAKIMREELEEFGTLKFYEEHSHKLIKPLIDIQRRGVKIDLAKRKRLKRHLEFRLARNEARLTKAVGYELNSRSPKQMKKFLYEDLKLPKQINRATGLVSCDEKSINYLASRYPNPVFDLVLWIRHISKLLGTYVEATVDEDGRIRCAYDIKGTVTGRLNSRESVYGSGTNLQNIPRGKLIRSLFIPSSGKQFINADLSQAEARVVAWLANESRLKNVFNEGGDIHKRNASVIFKKPLATITPDERQLAKTLVHAANYGIGARKFAETISSTEDHARALLNQYHANYPRIRRWHQETEEKLRKFRVLETPLGRKRMFFGRWSPELLREAIAYVPQSTVSDILNEGLVRAWYNLPPGWELVMQVHDSILLEVPLEVEPVHVWKFIHHYFERPIEILGEKLVIPVDIKIGKDWGNLKELKL